MSQIHKAGAVIARKSFSEPEILLLYRGKHQDWSFPKGHCEIGETNEDAMIREVREETGLDVVIRCVLPDLTYQDMQGADISVAMFLVVSKNDQQDVRAEYSHDRLEWVAALMVADRLSYQSLKDYFNRIQEDLFSEIQYA
jgi:ADP-ribose pyrophosphatase YjhB (NUDIX family)